MELPSYEGRAPGRKTWCSSKGTNGSLASRESGEE